MAKEWTRKISDQTKVQLELNLPEVFAGYYIPDSAPLRQAIGQEVIDIIRNRTQEDERSWTGASFKNYSEEYQDTMEFKAYGKKKDDPNLTQSGDMLGLMTVLDAGPGVVTVGWNDKLQSEKAHGHITGNIGVKRDFFGLSSNEVDSIKTKFRDQLETATITEGDTTQAIDLFSEGQQPIGNRSLNEVIDLFLGGGTGE